jgi:chorismate lyase/3-hydroxybenzoate synthase
MDGTSLQLDYVPYDELTSQPTSWWAGVLGVVGFERPPDLPQHRVPVTASMTPALGEAVELCEVWRVTGGHGLSMSSGSQVRGGLQYRHCDEVLFGSITVDEERFAGNASTALLQATAAAYEEIFALLQETRHPHLIRVWNYLPEINLAADGDERYRHFNSARQTAFRNSGRSTVGTVPAASALGSPAGSPISIYFLASSGPPTMIENPRQTSAYHYPPKFGAHSPTFSRACVLGGAAGTNLFISGTASILGHETVHRGDVAAQTHESLANIDALLTEANRIVGTTRYALDGLKFKVYVREPADIAAIETALAATVQPTTPVVYLQADVCREELLVEIEATGAAHCN